jgi:predicted nucleic acid-binding protein
VIRFVLDASIVLAWCFPDEDSSVARHIVGLFKQGSLAIAPSFWPHEVLNALLAGEKRKRISAALIQTFLNDLATLPIELGQVPSSIVFNRIQSLSREHALTAYDAAYLHIAIEQKLPLATLDEPLAKACENANVKLVRL